MRWPIWFCMVCLLSAVGMGAGEDFYPDCTVTEVTSVLGPANFTCKVTGGSRPSFLGSNITSAWRGVRLRVQIRGIEPLLIGSQAQKAMDFTKAKLKAAKTISLKNVKARNYFRVVADVEVDGRSLAKQLIANGLAEEAYLRVEGKPQQGEPVWKSTSQPKSTLRPKIRKPGQRPGSQIRIAWADSALRSQLRRVVDLSAFRSDMEFGDALEVLRNSIQPALPIVVLWRDLDENAFVDKSTPIGLEGTGEISIGKGLELLLTSVGGEAGELQYVIDGGVITIASKELELQRKVTRIYDMAELAASPSSYFGTLNFLSGNRQGPWNMGGGMGMGGYGGGGYGRGGYGDYGGQMYRNSNRNPS